MDAVSGQKHPVTVKRIYTDSAGNRKVEVTDGMQTWEVVADAVEPTEASVDGLSEDAKLVLEAVRLADQGDEPNPELHRDQVNDALRTPHGDKVTQDALAELADRGYLETTQEVDQIPGPITFRLAD
jgi:hypothetical protein